MNNINKWLQDIFNDEILFGDIYNSLYECKDINVDIKDEMGELIVSLDASEDGIKSLKKTPEFLALYYLIEKYPQHQDSKFFETYQKFKVILKNKVFDVYFDSYEEFKKF